MLLFGVDHEAALHLASDAGQRRRRQHALGRARRCPGVAAANRRRFSLRPRLKPPPADAVDRRRVFQSEFFKLGANPIPQCPDFLGRPACASVFGDTEPGRHRILEIHPRVRLCQNAEPRQAFCRFARSRAPVGRRALVENESSFALGEKDGAKGCCRRFHVEARRTPAIPFPPAAKLGLPPPSRWKWSWLRISSRWT